MKEKLKQHMSRPPGGWLSRLPLALALAAVLAAPAVHAAPTLPPDAEYSRTRLGPNPVGHAWGNVVPNALADYYTYVPYSSADATALGFPSSCGVSEDCYTITVKRFTQPLSLAPILGPAWGTGGLLDQNDAYFGPAGWTDVYGYGSGGTGWVPPQFIWGAGNTIVKNASPATLTKGNAPTAFAGFQFDAKDKGIWHFPAPSIKGTKGRPIRVQWLNELPNTIIPGHDPTVDCSDNAPNCFPYNRIVTHVHGAHVGPASDGLAHAGFNPDFSNVGTKFNLSVLPPTDGPPGTYVYPMDQEASTIWYHDHAVGTTHLNTNQGMAGFFPITDDNEKCLQGIPHPTLCPTPTKYLPTGTQASGYTDSVYELGFALQDRVFYTDGQFAMPDAPVIDGSFPSCDSTSAASRLATCAPLFMYEKHAADANSLTSAGIHMVPYDEFTMDTTIPENANAPLLGTSATLEFFGNMPVVNGVVYGKYDVEPRVYRMRFIGGTDSRTWDLQLEAYDAGGLSLGIIPFWQIGSEQGFLNNPAQRTDMLLMPGERLDVLVDFGAAKTLYPTMTKIMLNNLGTDAPFQGEAFTPFNRSVDIPEIMMFNMIALGPTPDVPAPSAALALQRAGVPLAASPIVPLTATPGTPTRVVALEEIVDEYQRIMPTIDRRGYDLPGMPATEIVKLFDTEQWDIINTSADAHPMHLHLVAFQVINRQPFTTFTPAINDPITGVFSQATYTVDDLLGPAVPPDPQDAGWKDTIVSPPGFVTRVIARFDKQGEYVWHCHILSHEEHDMMRPMKIVPSALAPPASLTVPSATPDDRTVTVTVAPATPANPVAEKYYVEYRKTGDANWITNALGSGTSQTFTFPSDGTYDLRAKAVDAAISATNADSSYTPGSNTILVAPMDSLSPAGGTLAGTTQTFTFTTSGAYPHYLWLGTSAPGSSELGRYTAAVGVNQITATGLPTSGAPVYARLWVKIGTGHTAQMRYRDYTFTATSISMTLSPSALTPSPQPVGAIVTFTASATGTKAPYQYEFFLSGPGGGWSLAQPVGSGTFNWDTAGLTPGAYRIAAHAIGTGTVSGYDAEQVVDFNITSASPPTLTLTPGAGTPSPQPVGTGITFTASATGVDTPYQYEFLISGPSVGWYVTQAMSPTATFNWNTIGAAAGTYRIAVHAKGATSPAAYDAEQIVNFTLTPVAATGVTLTPNPATPSPQNVGTAVTFTATASGGTAPYEYAFWLCDPAGNWTQVQGFGSQNTFNWITSGAATGTYRLAVHARSLGNSGFDVEQVISYTLTPVAATGVTLTPNPATPSPQNVGTLITFTAAASGGTAPYEYAFWVYNPSSGWALAQPYGALATFNWDTSVGGLLAGDYRIAAHARSVGSPNGFDAEQVVNFHLN